MCKSLFLVCDEDIIKPTVFDSANELALGGGMRYKMLLLLLLLTF